MVELKLSMIKWSKSVAASGFHHIEFSPNLNIFSTSQWLEMKYELYDQTVKQNPEKS